MSTPASFKDHPFHPMLIALPVGLWIFSLACDIIYLASKNPAWSDAAFFAACGGIIGALLAAIPGFIDWLSITDDKTKSTGTRHMIFNLSIVVLYIINIIIRANSPNAHVGPFILSIIGVLALTYSGWLGWDMVYEHGMGVGLEPDGRLKKGRVRPYEPAGETGRERATEPRTTGR